LRNRWGPASGYSEGIVQNIGSFIGWKRCNYWSRPREWSSFSRAWRHLQGRL